VPLAALSAILVVVAWKMGEWGDFREMRRYTMNYRAILIATFVLTVVFDLTVAVQAGLVMAAIFFITRVSSLTSVTEIDADRLPPAVRAYEMSGSLFFGSANKLEPLLSCADPGNPARAVVLDLQKTINVDTTGLDILEALRRKLAKTGKMLIISGAGAQPLSLFRRSGFAQKLGEQNLCIDRAAGMARAIAAAQGLR
jgi:SulP family sulfate permease